MLRITETNRKWWILAAMTTSISMIFVDITVLPVALPTIDRELDISDLQLQWIINAYTLVLTVLVLAGGRIGDMWGMKKTFSLGLFTFALASALCGASTSASWLIFSRCLQGVGGAFLIPATQSIIFLSFPPHQRGKAIGLFVSVGSIFLALGPLLGGSLTQYASWRYVFWINIPIALIGLIMAYISVPSLKGVREKFDYIGFFTVLCGITALVVGLMQAQIWGWDSFKTIGLFLLGLFFFILHFKIHAIATHPLIDFELLKNRSFLGGSLCIFLTQFLLIATIFWAIYFQNILGFSPSKAGSLAFLANIPVIIGAPIAGILVDRIGPKVPVIIGYCLVIIGIGFFLLFLSTENTNHLLMTLIPFGIGAPMTFTPSGVSIFSDIPPKKRGMASGLNATTRQFSATLGMAIFGTIFVTTQTQYMTKFLQSVPEAAHLHAQQIEGVLAHTPSATKILSTLSSQTAQNVINAAREGFLLAVLKINYLTLATAIIGIFVAYKMLSNRPTHKIKKDD